MNDLLEFCYVNDTTIGLSPDIFDARRSTRGACWWHSIRQTDTIANSPTAGELLAHKATQQSRLKRISNDGNSNFNMFFSYFLA